MQAFTYHRPATVEAAVRLLEQHPDGRLLAGGLTLIPVMSQRLASPTDVIDLADLTHLKAITAEGGTLTIGALVPHVAVADSPVVRERIPALAAVAEHIGDAQVRNRATIGGSIATNDPAADYPAAVLALDGVVRTNRRDIAADDFFIGMFETALEPAELVTHVVFPRPQAAAYVKFPQQASHYALAGVMVAKSAGAVRVAVTGAGPCVFRATEMEQALARRFDAHALDSIDVAAEPLTTDVHASAEYRAHLVSVMARRAVAAALAAG